ncbi:MAG TPA: hypothetical protein VFT79_09510 [Solirubrobacterales bacterium]|nr:hypothetical protein [Solirubrobacterales bacterium]
MAGRTERTLVRILIGAALCVALLAFAFAPIPQEANGDPSLPAAALGQVGLYRPEVALLTFYGALLLVTPVFSGLARGRLPTEISARGARFAEETAQSDELAEEAIEQLRQSVNRLADRVTAAETMIDAQQKR